MKKIVILGAGMAGFGAAYFLRQQGIDSLIFDKNSWHGGHTASFSKDGYIFDDGPHVSFTKNERIKNLFADSVRQEFEEIKVQVNNYWQGYWVKHPAQCNLYGLPEDLITDIIREIERLEPEDGKSIDNYAQWLIANFGKTFAETFPMPYGLKYHTVSADQMCTDWIGPRLYKPDLEEVIQGAKNPDTEDVHYVNLFRYPTHGGFVSFLDMFKEQAQVQLGHMAQSIDLEQREITFTNGKVIAYDRLVSSIPLPELLKVINNVPADIIVAGNKLACTSCAVINIGVDRTDLSEAVWTYFYDQDMVFARISFPGMLSPNTTPKGMGSIQAEVYFSKKYRPMACTTEELIEPVIKDLKRCGIIRDTDKITFTNSSFIRYANIIFDLDRKAALESVHGFLDEIGIQVCGRYGEWGYHWTDESFISGEKAAEKVL